MSNPLHAAIGTRMAKLRARRGWTVESLAIAAELTHEQVARHEAGDPIPVDRLWQIARALRVSLSAFFVDHSPIARDHVPTCASPDEGRALLAAFRGIDDAHLRAVLIDIADHFAGHRPE